jgi:serine/threonine-protein kinase HipA
MMNSKQTHKEAFVWIWLPAQTEPVVAGKLVVVGKQLSFNYGKSYLARDNAISIYEPELPLQSGALPLLPGLNMPGCIRDASPDAWGRRVLINKLLGLKGAGVDSIQLDELTYLLESGSDRIGALDFQLSATEYQPRIYSDTTLEELLDSAERVEKGLPLSTELDQALHHGSSIGGARPKALINTGKQKNIAKFSLSTDLYSVVKAEFVAMRLAEKIGLLVAPVSLERLMNKDVLLVERFDREQTDTGWQRRAMVSALTLFGLDEMMARYASYETLAEIIRHRFSHPSATLSELFQRMVYNILCGNTDDHARNHAAFWDGKILTLTPAYDICPQSRTGNEASQAMLISGGNRLSRISSCLEVARHFLLSPQQAIEIIERQLESIIKHWSATCDEAELNPTDRKLLWGRQFLNPFIFEDLSGVASCLKQIATDSKYQS